MSHTWCTEQVLAGARCWEVECHIERTQGQEVRRQSELLKGHGRGMTELPTQTSADTPSKQDWLLQLPSAMPSRPHRQEAGRIPQGQHVGSAASLREKVLLC